jgi:Helix-turn-helix domain
MYETEETLTDTKGGAKLAVVSPAILSAVEQPITTQQLADHLQVTGRTIATYRAKRLIPFWRLNSRNIRYRLSDVERALAKNNT